MLFRRPACRRPAPLGILDCPRQTLELVADCLQIPHGVTYLGPREGKACVRGRLGHVMRHAGISVAEQAYQRVKLAEEQLDVALDLFLSKRSLVSALPLAGAAKE